LGGKDTALGRLWTSHTAEWRRRIWVRKVKIATGTGYVTRYSMVEAMQKWLVERLHGRENQKREAKDALLERAEALRQQNADRTATATLEQLLEIQEALKALSYGVTLTRTQIGGVIWSSLSNYQRTKMDEYLERNQERRKAKSSEVVEWMFPLDKLNSKVKLDHLREMVRLADSFRLTARTSARPAPERKAMTPKRTRGGTVYCLDDRAYVMKADGTLQPWDEHGAEGANGTVAAAGPEGDLEEDDSPPQDDEDSSYGSLRAAPVGKIGPNRRLVQQHRNGRVNPSPRIQPGPQRIQTSGGTMFVAQQVAGRPIHCYNCGKEGHKRFECPEEPRTRKEQEAIMEKLRQLQPRPDRQPHAALILDTELACAARSVDLSSTENAQQAIDELGVDATYAVQDFLEYLGEVTPRA
jgi:hypothetical protein